MAEPARSPSSDASGPLADAVRARDPKALAAALADPRLAEAQRVDAARLALSSGDFKSSSAIAKTVTGAREASDLLMASAAAGDAVSCSLLAPRSFEHPSKALSEAVVHRRSAAAAALAPLSDLPGRGLPVLRALLADADPAVAVAASALPGAAGLVPDSDLKAFAAKRAALAAPSAVSKLRAARSGTEADEPSQAPRPGS